MPAPNDAGIVVMATSPNVAPAPNRETMASRSAQAFSLGPSLEAGLPRFRSCSLDPARAQSHTAVMSVTTPAIKGELASSLEARPFCPEFSGLAKIPRSTPPAMPTTNTATPIHSAELRDFNQFDTKEILGETREYRAYSIDPLGCAGNGGRLPSQRIGVWRLMADRSASGQPRDAKPSSLPGRRRSWVRG